MRAVFSTLAEHISYCIFLAFLVVQGIALSTLDVIAPVLGVVCAMFAVYSSAIGCAFESSSSLPSVLLKGCMSGFMNAKRAH